MKVNTFTNINIVNNPAPQTVEYRGKKRKKTRNLSAVIHVLVWDGLMRLIPTATTPYYSCVCSIQIVSLIGNPFLAMWFNSGHFDAQCTWSMFGCWREAIDTRVVCAFDIGTDFWCPLCSPERGLSYGITYFFNIVCLKTVRAKQLEQSLNHTRLPVAD